MIKAVFFDLDGTLVNSIADLANSTNFALSQFGFEVHDTRKYYYFVGDGMRKLIERALPESADENCKEIVFTTFIEHYRLHFADKTRPYDGICELLRQLKNMGIELVVSTNKMQEMAEMVIKKNFENIFSYVCGNVKEFPVKPNPEYTLHIMKKMGYEPSQCIFVGDSGIDMKTAKNAGMKSVGVLWGFRTQDELKENNADYIISKPSEIIEIISGLNNEV